MPEPSTDLVREMVRHAYATADEPLDLGAGLADVVRRAGPPHAAPTQPPAHPGDTRPPRRAPAPAPRPRGRAPPPGVGAFRPGRAPFSAAPAGGSHSGRQVPGAD